MESSRVMTRLCVAGATAFLVAGCARGDKSSPPAAAAASAPSLPSEIAIPGTGEDGIYDPHPALIAGQRYIVYSGMPPFSRVPQPDVYLARSRSGTWFGPWERLGKILDHADIPHHNAKDHPDYEWGLEGPQLVELPDGRVMLNATCFLPEGTRGTRQRVFFAIADRVEGPYRSLGPVLIPPELGENGHSTVMLDGDELMLFYQSRVESTGHRWRYGILRARIDSLAADLPQAA